MALMDRFKASFFLHGLFDLWESSEETLIPAYYHPDFIGHHHGQTFDLDALYKRFAYLHARYKRTRFKLLEFHLIDENTILSMLHHLSMDAEKNKMVEFHMAHQFLIEDYKIKTLWSLSSEELSVKEIDTASQTEDLSIASSSKKRFEKCLKIVHDYKDMGVVLTAREIDCLYYYIHGLSSKEIAPLLNISYRTVEKNNENIKKKYNLSHKSDLRKIFALYSPDSL